ncbi:MAG: multi-sensor signal transduction histidine kinase, partial [Halothiobacillaceae bacterium]
METGKIKRLGSGALPAVLLLAMLSVSLYLLNSATQDPQRFSEIYPTLLLVSGAELILLIVLIASNLIGLIRQYRSGATGSRVSVRLIFVFVVLAVVPVSVVYHFSLEFLQRGINSWFDV